MNQAVHVFYGVYLGFGHRSLMDIMQETAKRKTLVKGEYAIFLNKAWTGAKILTADGLMLYYKPAVGHVTPEALRYLPTLCGGTRMTFSKNSEKLLIDAYEKRFSKYTEKLKVAHG